MNKAYPITLIIISLIGLAALRLRSRSEICNSKPEAPEPWPPEAQKFLDDLYEKYGSRTYEQKYNLLELKLGGQPNNFSDDPSIETKCRLLEHEILSNHNLIKLVLA